MDPNLISEMMKNPEMMKMAEEMLKKNPNMMNDLMKGMGGGESVVTQTPEQNLEGRRFEFNEEVITNGLKNESFNGQNGMIKNYNSEKDRYEIYIMDMDKSILVREENLVSN